MNIVALHEAIDKWYQEQKAQGPEVTDHAITTESVEVKGERKLPEGKRAVRTKSQGDKVFYLDEEKKTRQWVTSPEVLDSLGFKIEDVAEVDDMTLMKYQMSTPIYKPVENAA